MKTINKKGITIGEAIECLEKIKKETGKDSIRILFGKADIGNVATNMYYNDGSKDSEWYGEFVVIEK